MWKTGSLLAMAAVAFLIAEDSALEVMQLQYTWGTFDYAFDSDQQRAEVYGRGNFAPQNTTPFDVDVDMRSGRIFLASPAILPGLLPTIATIKQRDKCDSPQIQPYPDWSWYPGTGACDKPVSVFRIYIDQCRRLWAIDSGVVDIGNSFQHACPPKLYVFDLKTDQLLAQHTLSVPSQYADTTLMLNVIAEQRGYFCNNDAYAYIADPGSFALYVYSLQSDESWRIESEVFRPDPSATQFSIDGSNFTLEDGILGLAQDDKDLYFHSFSSFQEGKVAKNILRKQSLFANGTNGAPDQFNNIGMRAEQSAGEALTKDGVMIFGQMATNSIYCWDSSTPYARANHRVVEHDDTLLHFVSSVKVIRSSPWNDDVWAIDNNGQRLFAGEFQPNLPHTVNIVRSPAKVLSSKCKRRWSFPF